MKYFYLDLLRAGLMPFGYVFETNNVRAMLIEHLEAYEHMALTFSLAPLTLSTQNQQPLSIKCQPFQIKSKFLMIEFVFAVATLAHLDNAALPSISAAPASNVPTGQSE